MTKPPRFRLFRLTKPMHDGCTHAGEVWLGGKMWSLTARVVTVEDGRKEFHGYVEAPGESIRMKLKVTQQANGDLVSQAAGMPFDDSLEGIK